MSRRHKVSLVTVAGALVLTACSTAPEATLTGSAADSAASGSANSSAVTATVDLSQPFDDVHGVVATGKDQLIVGTHVGAKRVGKDGKVTAQGYQVDDLMGMTGETGTDNLSSSGHSGAGSQFPNPLGLIQSKDSGKNWTAISLQGQVDFHVMAVSGPNIVGDASGHGGPMALKVSSDGGETWEDGAILKPAALAISGDRVLATTQSGLQISTDGGKTFTILETAPLLVLVSAGTNTSMLGIDTAGNAWRSSDRGATWTEIGSVGQVRAIAAYDETVGYAVSDSQLFIIG